MVCPNCSDMEDKVEMESNSDFSRSTCPKCGYEEYR